MNRVLSFFLMVLLLIPFLALGQGMNERMMWYFGNKAGLSFHTNPPSPLTDGLMITDEGCAVANDPDGKLLFYTDGLKVWNKVHKVMANGSGLYGNESSTQSALVLPQPGDPSKYFIFTTSAVGQVAGKGLHFSVVDMKLDHDTGDVTAKNIPLKYSSSEKLAATNVRNSSDFWVLARDVSGRSFYCYQLSAFGVNGSPVVSQSAVNLITTDGTVGGMCFSPDGTKLVIAYYGTYKVEIMDFNDLTGDLSNSRVLSFNESRVYYPCISPNSKYLYLSLYNTSIVQLDMSCPTVADMQANARTIPSLAGVGAMSLAPDGSIYVTRSPGDYLSRITYPDESYPACVFKDTAVFLLKGRSRNGLPNFVNPKPSPVIHLSSHCAGDTTFFTYTSPYQADSVHWDAGDSQAVSSPVNSWHVYAQPGVYNIRMFLYHDHTVEIVSKKLPVYAPFYPTLGNDTMICKGDVLDIKAKAYPPWFHSLWSNGQKDTSVIRVSSSGNYWIRIDNSYCYGYDMIQVILDTPRFKVDLGPDFSSCEGNVIMLDPGYTDAACIWQDHSTNKTFPATHSLMYWVSVSRPGFNCPVSDSINISFLPGPHPDLGPDKEICQGDSLSFDLRNKAYEKVLWQDGSRDSVYVARYTADYSVTAWEGLCFATDTVSVTVKPKAVLGLDKVYSLCKEESLPVDLSAKVQGIEWNDGSIAPQRVLKEKGSYFFSYTDQNCTFRDSFHILLRKAPQISFPRNLQMCEGEYLLLDPAATDATDYLWQDGSTAPVFTPDRPGVYHVKLSNPCGSSSDTVEVGEKAYCKCIFYVPDAFTPNQDMLNEGFGPVGCEPNYFILKIFNRWGEKIFETNDFDKKWDGTYKGRVVSDDTFAWLIEYAGSTRSSGTNSMMKGVVTLLK